MQKKSAKDIAFDRERARYRHMISELEQMLREKDAEITALRLENEAQKERNQQLTETIDELLACMKMSQVDLEKLMKRVETEEELQGTFSRLMRMAQGYF